MLLFMGCSYLPIWKSAFTIVNVFNTKKNATISLLALSVINKYNYYGFFTLKEEKNLMTSNLTFPYILFAIVNS